MYWPLQPSLSQSAPSLLTKSITSSSGSKGVSLVNLPAILFFTSLFLIFLSFYLERRA
eukprot:m.163727 g.163727  ORF g.163727 m.163727 type:complete len:58 (+) comp15217_c1_seq4:880-1053(+)